MKSVECIKIIYMLIDENSLKIRDENMKAYIYFIINKVTGERYVGQTTNFARRKQDASN